MNVWFELRELRNLVKMYRKAVVSDDALGAGALYGCLFDMLQIARKRVNDRKHGNRWKRILTYLDNTLDEIQTEAKDYPIDMQQALIAKVILRSQMKKAS